MPDLIHPAQAGFFKGRLATANIRKVLAVLEYTYLHSRAAAAIEALNAEKVFYNVSLQWLFQTLSHWASKELLLIFIRSCMPTQQQESILGTSYLIPLCFIKEPDRASHYRRCCLIWCCPDIHRIQLGGQDVKSALFADVVLLFTLKSEVDIPEFQAIFEEYGRFSGKKIHFHKSDILSLTIKTPKRIPPNSHFAIA